MKDINIRSRRQFLTNLSIVPFSLGTFTSYANQKSGAKNYRVNACNLTTLDYYGEGPFYRSNPPTIKDGQLADKNEPGTRMIISGYVYNRNCSKVLSDTVLDIWHANDAGQYDNAGFNLRGKIQSNNEGFYSFETIKPGKYLNGTQYRPSHIHFKITPPGMGTFTTQLYFEGDVDIPGDAAASVSSGTFDATNRIIPLSKNSEGKYEGTWDIALSTEITGLDDLHLNNGIIYKVAPNPFSNSVEIYYGVFKKSRVTLSVFDLHGRLIATLNQNFLTPEKYTALWDPPATLPDGQYIISLMINNMQVHYLRVLRKH